MSDVTKTGPPIDSARVWWFIKRSKFPNDWPSRDFRLGYAAAIDDLAAFMRNGGYEPPT